MTAIFPPFPGAAQHVFVVRCRRGTVPNSEGVKVPDLRCITISAFTRVFDALWCCTASGTRSGEPS